MRSMSSMASPCSDLIIRVDDGAVFAAAEPFDAEVEVVEHDVEMAGVAAGRLEPQARSPECSDGDEREGLEADHRRLLRELVDSRVRSANTEIPKTP